MIMETGNYATLILNGLAFTVMLCRVNELDWRKHQPLVLVFNLALALSTLWGAWRGWDERAEFGDLCIGVAALCWIAISYPSWRNGPPKHTESDHMPLDEAA